MITIKAAVSQPSSGKVAVRCKHCHATSSFSRPEEGEGGDRPV